ncbi:ABC-2 family transporter protein [Cohnella sp. OV330]|uniref:ABC transporter permease subunit n=1 Tax=Cohnella sp. OV330 TaxID=1855288 RepID=UPI0008E5D76C|nr:ABC transporter permease subunit [Cohnella sp. OV330]SFB52843.1 ABC-2 family transporter protein [Cohnella sp. OV330]
MRTKSLWYGMRPLLGREYAQARLFIFAVPIVHFLTLGLPRMNEWLWSEQSAGMIGRFQRNASAHGDLYRYVYDNGNHEVAGRLWLLLAAFVLALVQIGVERRNGSQELLFSLPYSRGRIFAAKWLLGASLFGGSLLLNTLIDAVVMAASPASHYFRADYFAVQFGYSLLVVLAGYSCALFIGTVTGSVASQTILTWVLAALPIVFVELLDASLQAHGIYMSRQGGYDSYSPMLWGDRIRIWLNFFGYASAQYLAITWVKAIFLIGLTIVSAGLGLLAYSRNPTENNGKLMVFKRGETVLRYGFVICASMVAGMLGTELFRLSAGDQFGYDIGFVLGCALSALGIRNLLRMRFKY